MRNFNFNWMKNAAKNTQTTGGGLRGGVRMRINLELPLTRYRADTVSLPCFGYTPGISGRLMKYAAMIFAVLTLSIANIGMAWGM